MTSAFSNHPNASWAAMLRLYPIYLAAASDLALPNLRCAELDEPLEAPPAETIAVAEKWFREMDEQIHVHHLRQYAQTSPLMSEGALRDLLLHLLAKKIRGHADRDKVDFLIVQYVSQRASVQLSDDRADLRTIAALLEPVLGKFDPATPEFLKSLDSLLEETAHAASLKALFTARIIERGRELKTACGERFFETQTLAAIARLGFLTRRIFFRLMQNDLAAILDGLRELESRGVTELDCRKAQFGATEPVSRLRIICQSWRVMFQAEYSSGQPLCILVDLRTAVEAALAREPAAEKPKAAAASPGKTARINELEVSGPVVDQYDQESTS